MIRIWVYAPRSPGTYAGMVEKLDYLQSLGVNAIELLPVFEFNELEYYSPIAGSDQFRCGPLQSPLQSIWVTAGGVCKGSCRASAQLVEYPEHRGGPFLGVPVS